MTLQELSEHYQLRAQLEKDEDILYNLRMAAIPSAHPLDGMPRAPGVSDKVGALAIAIVDMEERMQRPSRDYIVITEASNVKGNLGQIEVSDQLSNGFKVAYTGSATAATINYIVIGGYMK